jgi:chromatin modification-related protein EAF6
MAAIQKRRTELRQELTQLEKQIYDLESSYLEETKDIGNIFSGWAAYVSKDKVKVRKQILNEDRMFSLSSVTSPASRKEAKKVITAYWCV